MVNRARNRRFMSASRSSGFCERHTAEHKTRQESSTENTHAHRHTATQTVNGRTLNVLGSMFGNSFKATGRSSSMNGTSTKNANGTCRTREGRG